MVRELDFLCLNPPFLPRFSRYSRSPCVTTGGTLYYPLMECTAAAYAEKFGFTSLVLDAVASNFSLEDTMKLVKERRPRLITVATSTPSIHVDIAAADHLKAELPEATVVLVGRHASWAPEESLRACSATDGVVRSEYYKVCVALLQGAPLADVNGTTYRVNGGVKSNPDDKAIDPNEIPLISRILKRDLDIHKYFYASLRNPYTMLQHSWGCAFNCDFCDEFYKASYRHRLPDLTIEEMKFIEREMPSVKEILFDDPTFVINEKHTVELCEAMLSNKTKLTWSCNLRSSVSYETLKLMKRAGCRLAHVGIESLTQEGKDSIHKRISLENELQFLEDAKRAGILIHGCFIVGLPCDNDAIMRLTIDRAKSLPFDTIQAIPLIPTPNTRSWQWAKGNGFLTTDDYSKWIDGKGVYRSVVSSPDFTSEDTERWVNTFVREFYFRPSYILYKLGQSLRSWQEMKRNIASGMNLMKRFGGH